MLKTITIENYLSYQKEQTLDLVPLSLKDLPDNVHTCDDFDPSLQLLKSVGIYGYNNYGKTNFIKTYQSFIRSIVSNDIEADHFRSNGCETPTKATRFETEFILGNTKYRYGYEVLECEVQSEYLTYAEPKIRENYLFERRKQSIAVSKTWQKLCDKRLDLAVCCTRPNQLLLSLLMTQDGFPHIDEVAKWLRGNIIIPDDYERRHDDRAMMIIFHKDYQDLLYDFLEKADLGLKIVLDKLKCPDCRDLCANTDLLSFWKEKKRMKIEACPKHKELEDFSRIDRWKYESAGAYRYLMLSCYLAFAIKNKQLIFVDELESKLHVFLLRYLIKTFHDATIDKPGSQLIFTTHNTSLMSRHLFRRDQFILVEKDSSGASSLRRIHSPKSPIRAEASLEKEYMGGKVGGISQELKEAVSHMC
ncbi:MAG TPA: ATP-binding protein [Puia sp.]|nr:ATP-binding protein [Puia sp.]